MKTKQRVGCACKVTGVTLNRPVTNATLNVEIDYCPLHKSAPDLLAACKAFLTKAGSVERRMEIHDQARTAIAQAGRAESMP